MSKARLVLTALTVEGATPSQVAQRYGVHRSWVYRLKARYDLEGEAAFEPRSRRPTTSPTATPPETIDLVLAVRDHLAQAGLDAGADTIGWHLDHVHHTRLSRATINRILRRAGRVIPEPAKRPKSSYLRFQAAMPNECWQSDFTHYRLATGTDVEIITWLDDHSRYALHLSAHPRITAHIVHKSFLETGSRYGFPASTLTDNGMVYTVRFATGKGGRTPLETELRARGIVQKNSRPNHPTTCGKVERFQQTSRNGSARNPANPPRSPSCKPSWMRSSSSTTPGAPTDPWPTTPPRPSPTPAVPRLSRAVTAPVTATTASATTKCPKPATPPSATTAGSTTSASAEPTPEPSSAWSSTTSTSPSSTPPPAKYSANSSSTPTGLTNPAEDPAKQATDLHNRRSVDADVLRHHNGRGDRI